MTNAWTASAWSVTRAAFRANCTAVVAHELCPLAANRADTELLGNARFGRGEPGMRDRRPPAANVGGPEASR